MKDKDTIIKNLISKIISIGNLSTIWLILQWITECFVI